MKKRKKPDFNLYYNKIIDYAKLCSVTILHVETLTDKTEKNGVFLGDYRTINISGQMGEAELICTLLHELGHFEDDCNHKEDPAVVIAYDKLYKDKKLTPIQKNKILLSEKRAWDYGRGIAKKLNIPLGSWYNKSEKKALATYRAVRPKRN